MPAASLAQKLYPNSITVACQCWFWTLEDLSFGILPIPWWSDQKFGKIYIIYQSGAALRSEHISYTSLFYTHFSQTSAPLPPYNFRCRDRDNFFLKHAHLGMEKCTRKEVQEVGATRCKIWYVTTYWVDPHVPNLWLRSGGIFLREKRVLRSWFGHVGGVGEQCEQHLRGS